MSILPWQVGRSVVSLLFSPDLDATLLWRSFSQLLGYDLRSKQRLEGGRLGIDGQSYGRKEWKR